MTKNSSTTTLSLALAAVADIASHAARGDMALARESRATLDTLCWDPKGYPAPVRAALEAAGLRSAIL
jgi:hypothetical protein